jgi:hypothetical protein
MAFPSAVNTQITDAVAQPNLQVLGTAQALALAQLQLATSQSLANAAHNATHAQQQMYAISQAATTAGVELLLSLSRR